MILNLPQTEYVRKRGEVSDKVDMRRTRNNGFADGVKSDNRYEVV